MTGVCAQPEKWGRGVASPHAARRLHSSPINKHSPMPRHTPGCCGEAIVHGSRWAAGSNGTGPSRGKCRVGFRKCHLAKKPSGRTAGPPPGSRARAGLEWPWSPQEKGVWSDTTPVQSGGEDVPLRDVHASAPPLFTHTRLHPCVQTALSPRHVHPLVLTCPTPPTHTRTFTSLVSYACMPPSLLPYTS